MLKYIVIALLFMSSATADIAMVDFATLLDNEITCLADNIYFEARNESTKGQLAVALVTINRVKSDNYPDSICAVVWQKNFSKKYNKYVAQFSWTLDGLSDEPKNRKAYLKSVSIAEYLIYAQIDGIYIADFTENATHYHADYVRPYWAPSMQFIAMIDTHIFYKYKK